MCAFGQIEICRKNSDRPTAKNYNFISDNIIHFQLQTDTRLTKFTKGNVLKSKKEK